MLGTITDADLVGAAVDAEQLALLRTLAPSSSIVVPLLTRERVVGVIVMLRCGDRPPFDGDDLVLVEDLAGRAALAVDNARLFASRSEVARTLQRSLLPPALPDVPGVQIATRYRVAGDDMAIGGDFYDVFELGDGAWAAVIGDVCGRGTEAAALTGLVRHTLRTATMREVAPSRILDLTNRVILDQIDDSRFCTMGLLRVERRDGGLSVVASCGGHPPPLVLRRDGSVDPVPCTGTLIGALPDPTLHDCELSLADGEAIVLYTDGVTEARRGAELFGEARLVEALEGQQALDASDLADRVERSVERFRGGAGVDDTAVLVLRAVQP